MTFENVEKDPIPRNSAERLRSAVTRLRELTDRKTASFNVSTLHVVDSLIRRFPISVQELLHNSVAEGVTGIPLPPSVRNKETAGVIDSLYGISSITKRTHESEK